MNKRKKAQIIWAKYCTHASMSTVNRAGYWRLGYIEPQDAKSDIGSHPENDLEHSHKCVVTISLLKDFFPNRFDYVSRRDYDAMSDHEIGELIIGDICDDGSNDVAAKDEKELELMKEYLKDFPKKARKRRLKAFKALQSKKVFTYLIDKFDFLMGQLYLIKNGFKTADMSLKIETGGLSPSDLRYIEETGSSRAIDVCFAHALDNTSGIDGRDILILIIEAAYADVGIEVPDGVKKFY